MNVMKKIAIVFGALIGLFVIAAIAVPMFVDVDTYRPQIVSAADQKLNGKLELGKLSLSLWGQIRIRIDGLQLTDARGRKVITVKDAYFHVPFLSILSGSPALILSMKEPSLSVVKDKAGKLNVMTLVKSAPAESSSPASGGAPSSSQTGAQSGETKLPGVVAHSRLGVDITHALLTYQDEALGNETRISGLEIAAHDISLTHKMTLEMMAELDSETKAAGGKGGATIVKGPIRLTASADPKVSGGKFESVDLKANLSLDDLDIRVGDIFHKAKGVDAHADIAMKATPESASIQSAVVKFFNSEIQGKGTMTHLSAKDAAGQSNPDVSFSMKSNTIDLKPWNQLVPMLAEYELAGNAGLDAEVNGPSDKLGYKAHFKVNALTAKAPNLKAQPQFDAVVNVSTDQIDQMTLTMKAPGNDLKMEGKILHFQAPQVTLRATSTGMDLDKLIQFPETPSAKIEKQAPAAPVSGGGKGPATDLDASLEPLRASKAMQAMVVNLDVDLREIKAKGVSMTGIVGKASMRDLVAGVESASLRVFGGAIKGTFATNLRPHAPTYKFETSVSGLDLAQAVSSQFSAFKNTLVGKANLEMSGTGSSFNAEPAIANLNAKGKLKVENATFSTLDVSKIVSEGINGAIAKIGGKIPSLQGKKVGGINGESRYDYVASDFTVRGGEFSAPNFVGKAVPNKAADLKGNVMVGLKDQSVKANFEVIDTYNMTHARDLSINQAGVEVNHILAEGNNPVRFPVSVGCTLSQPCVSYGQVTEYLGKIATNNAVSGLKTKAKSELQNRAKDALKGIFQGGGGGDSPLSNIGKKLFGH